MTNLDVTVRRRDGTSRQATLQVARIANLGMAGRGVDVDDDAVAEQVREMNEAGVATPERLPFVTPKPNNLITTANAVQVNSTETAGEAEFVLFPHDGTVYVGVGNDHKDFSLVSDAMHTANSTCPSVVSDEVWVLDDVRDHWDEIRLRSWVERDGTLTPYQQASMADFVPPDELLDAVDASIEAPLAGTAVWSGTVGAEGVDPFPEIVSGDFYAVQLYDPVLDRRLFTRYDVRVNDWITDVDVE